MEQLYSRYIDDSSQFSMRKLKTEVIEKLVSFVREYPLLYDRTDGYYKDSQMAYSTWDVIAQDMECPSMTGKWLENIFKTIQI